MQKHHLFVGTYTEDSESHGVNAVAFDAADGSLALLGTASAGPNPSFLAARGNTLYAANELESSGRVSAFRIGADGVSLTPLGVAEAPGSFTCHVALSPNGRQLYAANYGSGNIFGYALAEDGRFGPQTALHQHRGGGPNAERQDGPHAHSTGFAPDGQTLLAADLGTDELWVYRVAPNGALTPAGTVAVPPGEGPRHFVFHPGGGLLYLLTELGNHVITYRWANGRFAQLGVASTLPAGFAGENTAADIHLSPGGRFLYASNRGHDSIAVFALEEDGLPAFVAAVPCGGRTPRNFWLAPGGSHMVVANQDTDNLAAFPLNTQTGLPGEKTAALSIPKPVCVIQRA